ncbi:MAG TPA: nucleoside hydrolase [Candidatus Limnocylindrales bacterium]|jgi:inosine-uridine nucleoside N-ribohydrolase|nr:nucleoside hydrolase [Candidatus Limnocylindrales bacterium]
MVRKVILDVDTGTDDAVALMLAALHPELELVAATTVNGNVPVEYCTENSLRVFDHIGVSVPVYEGVAKPIERADFPIQRPDIQSSSAVHGGYLDIPPSRSAKQSIGAVEFLIETYLGATDEIILVPVGPLSNVATALIREPRLKDRIPELVIMGGANRYGNVTPRAEFNVWADPEAARIVINSGVRKITLVPLDATHQALVSLDDCAALRALGTPAGDAAATFTERRIQGYDTTQPMKRPHAAPVHDALAVASIVDPAVITTHHLHVDVETKGELTVGETVVDTNFRSRREPNVHVALDADERRFVAMLLETFARDPRATIDQPVN